MGGAQWDGMERDNKKRKGDTSKMSIKERKAMIGRIRIWLENDVETAVDILAQLVIGDYTTANLMLDLRRCELEREAMESNGTDGLVTP
jgi:hypothetical protein